MSAAARHVLHVAILRDVDLPVAGWEHWFTASGDDGVGVFYFSNADAGIDLNVRTTAEGQTSEVFARDRGF